MTTIEADIANPSPRLVGEPCLYPTRLLNVGVLIKQCLIWDVSKESVE
jgi:hypothetical protein